MQCKGAFRKRRDCDGTLASHSRYEEVLPTKDNNVDVEMDDVRTGENAMAKDILSFITTKQEWEQKYG